MNRIFILSICLLLLGGYACKNTVLSISGKEEKAFVSEFLDRMVESNDSNERPFTEFIAPSYAKKNNLKSGDYKIDSFSPVGFTVESYRDYIVTALIWGEEKSWTHRIKFKLTKEQGRLYLVPSSYEEEYVTPWWSVDRYVNQ